LDAELASRRERALSRYADAIRTDPGNPFAYLALARFYADARDSERALENLERAQSLLDAEQPYYPSVEPHLRGLRGWSLAVAGQRASAEPLLAEARRLAPVVWDDARLDARELR
jgi:tetratricopeptide (TPR) repeat protein